MTAHTPGPWTVEERETCDGELWVTVLRGAFDVTHNRAAEPGVIADARYSAMTPEENRANAYLIASAPDLLAALSALVEPCECHGRGQGRHGQLCDQARAALAKARGEAVKG